MSAGVVVLRAGPADAQAIARFQVAAWRECDRLIRMRTVRTRHPTAGGGEHEDVIETDLSDLSPVSPVEAENESGVILGYN